MMDRMLSQLLLWLRLLKKFLRFHPVKLLLLFVVCLLFYTFSSRDSTGKVNDTDTLLGPAYMLIKDDGKIHMDDIPELAYQQESIKLSALHDLRSVMRSFVAKCKTSSVTGCESKGYASNNVLLTLFTSWVFDKDKFVVNNNTLFNWKKLSNVRLVVFSNDSTVATISGKAGWEVLPIKKEVLGAPVLPDMMMEVMAKFDSQFYGFANGDLLFTKGLTDTLEAILCQLTGAFRSETVLVVGKRTNVLSEFVQGHASSWEDLETISLQHGTPFAADAEDYFITNRKFPWSSFLPVAIGRVGYDNWIVTYARLKNFTVIDATDTILCVHQTLESRGNYEGHHKGEYNVEMVENLKLPLPVFTWGKTDCAGTISMYDLCGKIVFIKRSSLPEDCTEYNWTYRLWRALGFANKTVHI